jgi:hypothetical protein
MPDRREAGVQTTSSVRAVAGFAVTMQAIADDVERTFGALTAAQLNWKPSPQVWSIAQCLDHLMASNSTYMPIVELVLAGQKPTSIWQAVPLLPRMWGKLLIRQLSPENKRKTRTVRVFEPSSSPLGADIVARFVAHQQDMIRLIERTAQLDLEHIIITSPALGFVTYSLRDAYEIIVVHEQRHVLQAKRLLLDAETH